MTNPIKVVLADAFPVILESLASCISREPDMQIVGMSTNTGDAIRLILEREPHVAVLDCELPGNRGAFDMVSELSTRQPQCRIIFFAAYFADVFVDQALQAIPHAATLCGSSSV